MVIGFISTEVLLRARRRVLIASKRMEVVKKKDEAFEPSENSASERSRKKTWSTLENHAEELHKHQFHVKDAWRRIKLPNMKNGQWSHEEYQTLFDLVNMDIRMKALQEKKSKHGML
ncbi:hypothetical protein Nepgr_032036 [Nepenthes gracilis]|uniref:Uncharacterized protein n=1 Tax=Nepenthes gracilis TaxID=150966 RepID=A0AAD3Y5R3_NEPGR|nr:hypothetical protein Nepgr_032036 [Nepenthes gracilis]